MEYSSNLTELLVDMFGINFISKMVKGNKEIRPLDLEYGEGFRILIKTQWRKLSCEFIPDNFSATLIRTMSKSEIQKKKIFMGLLKNIRIKYDYVEISISGERIDNNNQKLLFSNSWTNFSCLLEKSPLILAELSECELEKEVAEITCDLLTLILSLLPLEEIQESTEAIGLPEGAKTRIEVNKFERSKYNRQVCLAMHGHRCKVCDISMEEKYGQIGKDYIHVHHIIPVSENSEPKPINPLIDLVPVCPNCHAMIHKKTPPYTVNEMKKIITH